MPELLNGKQIKDSSRLILGLLSCSIHELTGFLCTFYHFLIIDISLSRTSKRTNFYEPMNSCKTTGTGLGVWEEDRILFQDFKSGNV